jgi:hypothetical protein
MSNDTQKPTAARALRDAIATLESASRNLHFGAGNSGWHFHSASCGYIANAIDLVLDTHELIVSAVREFGGCESDWSKAIEANESKLVEMANQQEKMKRVFDLGILRKE